MFIYAGLELIKNMKRLIVQLYNGEKGHEQNNKTAVRGRISKS